MSILDQIKRWTGGGGTEGAGGDRGDTDTVRKIVSELDSLDNERARYVASFAYILGRAANADLDISEVETRKMEELVSGLAGIGAEHAMLVVQIAKSQHKLFAGTENFLVTREFRELSSVEERLELLSCLFAVTAADDSISGVEEAQVRQVASELGLSHRQYVDARSQYSSKRDVMKGLER